MEPNNVDGNAERLALLIGNFDTALTAFTEDDECAYEYEGNTVWEAEEVTDLFVDNFLTSVLRIGGDVIAVFRDYPYAVAAFLTDGTVHVRAAEDASGVLAGGNGKGATRYLPASTASSALRDYVAFHYE